MDFQERLCLAPMGWERPISIFKEHIKIWYATHSTDGTPLQVMSQIKSVSVDNGVKWIQIR